MTDQKDKELENELINLHNLFFSLREGELDEFELRNRIESILIFQKQKVRKEEQERIIKIIECHIIYFSKPETELNKAQIFYLRDLVKQIRGDER